MRITIKTKTIERHADVFYVISIIWAWAQKACLRRFENNEGADQPAHPPSQISAFVIHLFQYIIAELATSEFLIF